MSQENIAKFNEAVAADATLATKYREIQFDAAAATAEELAKLSATAGLPFTAAEFLQDTKRRIESELSDEQLEVVAGGVWKNNAPNVLASILSVGISCALVGMISAGAGDADKCQPSDAFKEYFKKLD